MFARRIIRLGVVFAALVALACAASADEAAMPKGFVYLRDVDPTIQQDMRYAGPDNFTGRPVPGYEAGECILVRPAAEALKAAQAELAAKGLSLKVYDCYRPTRAVAAFVAWAKEPDDLRIKRVHYPDLQKTALFPAYIATRSGHSRGATVDVTLVPAGSTPMGNAPPETAACTDAAPRDNSLDMGVSFDCFDPKANSDTPGLTPEQRRNRKLLLDVMARHGFRNYPKEIWHYSFKPEPYPGTYFDFPVRPRQTAGTP
ncbi:M15 family metallopeptidase [Methyloligella sp. GL2]|nr:M15 family metallopeptidase [Methyloligella sp. GL2]